MAYNSHGQVITNALNETVVFKYSTNGYLTNIVGAIPSATTSFTYDGYDSLGRMTNVVNAMGTFSLAYTNATARLHSILYPNGQQTVFDYQNTAGDNRLAEIKHLASGGASHAGLAAWLPPAEKEPSSVIRAC